MTERKKPEPDNKSPRRDRSQQHRDRVTEQMRENLKRRKAQARERGQAAAPTIKNPERSDS